MIMVDYDSRDAVVDTEAALDPAAPLVWPERGSNVAFEYRDGDKAAADAAFAAADRVVSLKLINNRVVANYMETRGAIGSYDPATGRWTLTATTQGGHGMRDVIARKIMKVDPARIRVITPDVGGAFGTKSFPIPNIRWC